MARFSSVTRDLRTVLVAVLVSTVLAAAPAMAAYDALNADTVDGKDAVAADVSISKRAGHLVAADDDGYLPDNIVKKVSNSAKLGGQRRSAFVQHRSDAGELQTGLWAVSGVPGDYSAAQVEFAERLRGSLQLDGVEVHRSGSTSKTCPGPGQVSRKGYLCLYVTAESNLNFLLVHDPSTGEVGVSPDGMVVLAAFTDSGHAYGTYAVRSPK